VKTQQPIASEQEHRVLKFRPRTLPTLPAGRGTWATSLFSTKPRKSRTTCRATSETAMNRTIFAIVCWQMCGLAFTVALTAIGIWLAVSIADLRKTQDCVLMGRRDCARISTTHF